ncbi:hypothetical protein BJ138DRAFT_1067927 [Hygrophoropsis aurantiaca]|uniref:Uncharacterized protein n=1 Tax=Hygrophoropsis aurantiaca TaxID=72124 RepID=A0ACB8A7C7_9AGAM|nr:hypothetical protein BJ138DRAFT_1067927 [Hygrophoropsis aurantiaca]
MSSMSFLQKLKGLARLSRISPFTNRKASNSSSFNFIRIADLTKAKSPPFYEVKHAPDLIVRLAWPFLLADVIWTLGGVDLIWKHWTQPVSSDSVHNSQSNSEPSEKLYELRPVWQRACVSAFNVVLGFGWASIIIMSSARNVRRLWLVPRSQLSSYMPSLAISGTGSSPSSKSRLPTHAMVAEGFLNFRKQARMYDLKECYLTSSGRGVDDLILHVGENVNGKGKVMGTARDGKKALYISIKWAAVNGSFVTPEEARLALLKKLGK